MFCQNSHWGWRGVMLLVSCLAVITKPILFAALAAVTAICAPSPGQAQIIPLQNATATFSQNFHGSYLVGQAIDGDFSGGNGWAIAVSDNVDATTSQIAVFQTVPDVRLCLRHSLDIQAVPRFHVPSTYHRPVPPVGDNRRALDIRRWLAVRWQRNGQLDRPGSRHGVGNQRHNADHPWRLLNTGGRPEPAGLGLHPDCLHLVDRRHRFSPGGPRGSQLSRYFWAGSRVQWEFRAHRVPGECRGDSRIRFLGSGRQRKLERFDQVDQRRAPSRRRRGHHQLRQHRASHRHARPGADHRHPGVGQFPKRQHGLHDQRHRGERQRADLGQCRQRRRDQCGQRHA